MRRRPCYLFGDVTAACVLDHIIAINKRNQEGGKNVSVSLWFEWCIDTIWLKVCGFSKGVCEDKQVRQWGLPFSFLKALPPRIVDCSASNNQQTTAYGFILKRHTSPTTQFSQVTMPVTIAHCAICFQRGERSMCLSYNPPPHLPCLHGNIEIKISGCQTLQMTWLLCFSCSFAC